MYMEWLTYHNQQQGNIWLGTLTGRLCSAECRVWRITGPPTPKREEVFWREKESEGGGRREGRGEGLREKITCKIEEKCRRYMYQKKSKANRKVGEKERKKKELRYGHEEIQCS